ncbi:MAG: hypothetical protein ACKVS8_04580 [Phycisphaerales bacterium]
MKPHPRIRKAVKWGGLVATLLLTVAWIGSGWQHLSWHSQFDHPMTYVGHQVIVSLDGGQMAVYERLSPSGAVSYLGGHWARFTGPFNWWFGTVYTSRRYGLAIPIWLLVLPVLIPTALAWRLDHVARRRARIGACPTCGYDRRGIAATVACPECGTPSSNMQPERQ